MPTEAKSEAPIFVVGATGTGKSAVVMELARRFAAKGEKAAILAMDAMQVYRGADIGTSKPTAEERAEFSHGGLDLIDFGASFDVAQYLKHAEALLREQREAGRRVIIVGGTGLYFRALTRGLCEAPQGSDELRAELNALSVPELQARLKAVDAEMLERIDAVNPRRLVRAIEVKEATGRSLRDWQDETPEPLVREFSAYWIQREKEELNARIEARVEEMFARGWVEEVRGLVERHGVEAVQGFAGIGYREIEEMLETNRKLAIRSVREFGEVVNQTTAKAKRDICVATRQYAKRQLTWFAREPKLTAVILTGNQTFSAALSAATMTL